LCDKCAEKWSYGHKCATSVQLHAIQELWDLMSEEKDDPVYDTYESSDQPAQLCVSLSEAAVNGTEAPRSMRLVGTIQGQEVLILVDSGSSHTFISSTLAAQLSGSSVLHSDLWVKVANGATVCCTSQFREAKWEVQGYEFTSDFKVILLQHYDAGL
jgi:hypothetical protein